MSKFPPAWFPLYAKAKLNVATWLIRQLLPLIRCLLKRG